MWLVAPQPEPEATSPTHNEFATVNAVVTSREVRNNYANAFCGAGHRCALVSRCPDRGLGMSDAMAGHDTLTLRIRREGACIVVSVENDGPEIPAEIQSRAAKGGAVH